MRLRGLFTLARPFDEGELFSLRVFAKPSDRQSFTSCPDASPEIGRSAQWRRSRGGCARGMRRSMKALRWLIVLAGTACLGGMLHV
jgi:hypothetical protein